MFEENPRNPFSIKTGIKLCQYDFKISIKKVEFFSLTANVLFYIVSNLISISINRTNCASYIDVTFYHEGVYDMISFSFILKQGHMMRTEPAKSCHGKTIFKRVTKKLEYFLLYLLFTMSNR